jgi:hypothetical protein
MPVRVDLPGGQWAEMRSPDELTGGDKDAWLESMEFTDTDQELPGQEPENPAVMPDPAQAKRRVKVRITMANLHKQRDMMLGRLITGWSYADIPLPYSRASRDRLPLSVCNALEEAVKAHVDALNGTGPDPKEETSFTSGSTSPDAAPTLLPDVPSAPSEPVSG